MSSQVIVSDAAELESKEGGKAGALIGRAERAAAGRLSGCHKESQRRRALCRERAERCKRRSRACKVWTLLTCQPRCRCSWLAASLGNPLGLGRRRQPDSCPFFGCASRTSRSKRSPHRTACSPCPIKGFAQIYWLSSAVGSPTPSPPLSALPPSRRCRRLRDSRPSPLPLFLPLSHRTSKPSHHTAIGQGNDRQVGAGKQIGNC